MPGRGNEWECPCGDGQTYIVTIGSPAGGPMLNVYAGTEPLFATVSEGETQAAIAGVLTPSWNTPAAGTVNVSLNGAATAGMTAGYYKVKLEVTYAGQRSPFYYGWLRLLPIPAGGVEAPTYCSLQDILDKAGEWLPTLQQSNTQTNFLDERARARSWLDDVIISRSRVFAYRFDLNYALYYGSFPFGPVEAPDQVIAGYLALNYLIVKPRTIETVAYKALAYICEKRQSFDSENGDPYRDRANWYHARASNSLRSYRAELDTNGDGNTDVAFNLGVLTFR